MKRKRSVKTSNTQDVQLCKELLVFETIFQTFAWVYSIFVQRGIIVSFEKIKKSIDSALGRDFTLDDLAALNFFASSLSLAYDKDEETILIHLGKLKANNKGNEKESVGIQPREQYILTSKELDDIKKNFHLRLVSFQLENVKNENILETIKQASQNYLPSKGEGKRDPWPKPEDLVSVKTFAEDVKKSNFYKDQLSYITSIPESPSQFADEFPQGIDPKVIEALLLSLPIEKLYSHQFSAISELLQGFHVIVSTSTSSGKSLIYGLPILSSLVKSRGRDISFCIFPTKALAQDQKQFINRVSNSIEDVDWIRVNNYDGDTPFNDRQEMKNSTNVFLINPDILHVSILPNHKQWSHVLKNLRYVVLDELHYYHRKFGSHVAMVLRRLIRLCQLYGNYHLQFVCSSGTIGNPLEHFVNLTGIEEAKVKLITKDGSPRTKKQIIFWNPPIFKKPDFRVNPLLEACKLLSIFIQSNIRTMVFCKTRRFCEIITSKFHQKFPDRASVVKCYRGGYSPELRREIESELFSGKLLGVVTTNALELGIDIGYLDVIIHSTFPDSKNSFWQQAGRAGRREQESISIIVANQDYRGVTYLKNPESFLEGPTETVHINFEDENIFEKHLLCAAYENPVSIEVDQVYFGKNIEKGFPSTMIPKDGHYFYDRNILKSDWPAKGISIRETEDDNLKIVDFVSKMVLEEIEVFRAATELHPEAVYFHQGKTSIVKQIDRSNKVIYVEEKKVDYWTKPKSHFKLEPKSVFKRLQTPDSLELTFGIATTRLIIDGYFRVVPWNPRNVIAEESFEATTYEYDGHAIWIDFPVHFYQSLSQKNIEPAHIRDGLHIIAHSLCSAICLHVRCDSNDVVVQCNDGRDDSENFLRLFISENKKGGIGILQRVFEIFSQIIEKALTSFINCLCPEGCRDCVGWYCVVGLERKSVCIMILQYLLDEVTE